MRLRRTAAEPEPEPETLAEPEVAQSKGRPTPKRRDAAPRRQPVSAPKTTKEATQRRKQQAAQGKSAGVTGAPARSNVELREARMRGDEDALARKDRGVVRRFTRNYVDSHRMAANYLLLLLPLYLITLRFPTLSLIPAGLLVILLGECYLTARKVRGLAIAKFGETRETTMGLTLYVMGRAYLPRKWRVPKPQRKIGDPVD